MLFWLNVSAAPGTISEIRVAGNKKIETSAILEKITIKKGDAFDVKKLREDIQGLYDMGYFEDIRLERDGTVLILAVTEKPSISAIEFEGNEEIDDTDLTEKAAIKTYEMVNYTKIQKAIGEIQKSYEEKGYLLARVDFELKSDKTGQSSTLVFKITENDKVRVKRVSFIGNKNITSQELRDVMGTQEGGLFSFLGGGGTYKQEIFDDDVKRLTFVYLNKGYVQAKVSRPEVSVTPDKKGIFISIKVEEGEQFQVGEIDFAGDLLFAKSELNEAIKLDEPSDHFSYEVLQNDLRALEAKYGDLGYAYANIIPRVQPNEKERRVNVTYEIDKGQKVRFRKINIVGNTSTRDKVVRRELRILEGELYNETRKRSSLANIRRLGYFEDVQFITKTPPGRDDEMDIDVIVKERNTGQFQLGAGYATALGAQLNVQLDESNFMGYGYKAGMRIEYNGNRYQNYTLSVTDPYFRDTFWSVGSDLQYSDSRFNQFVQQNQSAALRAGHPLFMDYFENNTLYAFMRYKLDDTFVKFDERRLDVSDVLDPNTVNGVTSSMTFSLEYDKRNDRMMPTDGTFASLSYEYAGIGGDINFNKFLADARWYKNIFWDVVFRNRVAYGSLGTQNGGIIPFTEKFRLGGPNNLRGYTFRNVGTRVLSNKLKQFYIDEGLDPVTAEQRAFTVIGGNQQFYYMAELEFPLAKEAGMRAVVFYDIGQAEDDLAWGKMRSDFGFGIRWFSPMGPLRFEFGFPLDRKSEFGERSNNFQFAVGSPF